MIFLLSCTALFLLATVVVLWRLNRGKSYDESGIVHIKSSENGYQLYRQGKPFYIKGAGGDKYFKELSETGANTVRLYDTLNIKNALDEAHKYNLAVIVDLPMYRFSTDYNPYLVDSIRVSTKRDLLQTVRKYKNHPAVLMWNLGNELQYPTIIRNNKIARNLDELNKVFAQLRNRRSFIDTFNELIDLIHKEDPNHPVTTSISTDVFWKQVLSIHLFSPDIDVLGYNIFAPPNNIRVFIDRLSYFIRLKPYYLSEWGIEGPWAQKKTTWGAPIETTSIGKAEKYLENHAIFKSKYRDSMGSIAFYWGQKQETTHTWFSIFDEEGRKSQVFYALKYIWKDESDSTEWTPQIKHLVLNNKGAENHLFFKPNEVVQAQLFFKNSADSTFRYQWELYEEEWNYLGGGVAHKKPKQIETFIEIKNDSLISFTTPSTEGPYRIFVNIYNQKGGLATANVPFYVLKPEKQAHK